MEQPSPTNDSKHLQEDTERAISRAAAEQEERSPEALLNAVCKINTDATPRSHLSSVKAADTFHKTFGFLPFSLIKTLREELL